LLHAGDVTNHWHQLQRAEAAGQQHEQDDCGERRLAFGFGIAAE
jgi:hypothetical protein